MISSDDEDEDTVEPSVPLLSEKGYVAETPWYGFEKNEEEENDKEVDDYNEQKQKNPIRDNKRKRFTVSNKSKKSKKYIIIQPCVMS